MTGRRTVTLAAVSSACLLLSFPSFVHAQANDPMTDPAQAETRAHGHARGTFEVRLTPHGAGESAQGTTLSRMAIDKRFLGDLEGTSSGEMLAASTSTAGSAGYVAIERVSGTLNGRSGTFILQHNGTMTRGAPHLIIMVVPDSGTGELTGLSGTMAIIIEGGKHSYDFSYTLPADQ